MSSLVYKHFNELTLEEKINLCIDQKFDNLADNELEALAIAAHMTCRSQLEFAAFGELENRKGIIYVINLVNNL